MKKVLLLLFVVGLVGSAHAQFGVRAGFTSSNFSDTNFEPRSGFHAGVYYGFGENFLKVEPGLFFSQKGYTGTDDQGRVIDEQLNYVEIPVLFRMSLIPALNVFLGPQISFLASRNYQLGDETSTSLEVLTGYDLAGVAGAQVVLPLNFNLQASYDFGLRSLNYFNTSVKNQAFKVSLGYSF